MRPEIKKSTAANEFLTEERCHILEIANDTGDEQISISRARVESGITTAWHRLKGVSERYIIVSGQGRVELNSSEPVNVSAGDTPQRITNTGKMDLVFFCVCSPRFNADCYESLE